MRLQTFVAIIALLLTVSSISAGEAIVSGLQPGANVPAFQVDDITGAHAGKSTCYV